MRRQMVTTMYNNLVNSIHNNNFVLTAIILGNNVVDRQNAWAARHRLDEIGARGDPSRALSIM